MFWFVSAVGLETGSGRAGLGRAFQLLGQAGPVFLCSVTGRAETFSGRVGLDIFGPCRPLVCNAVVLRAYYHVVCCIYVVVSVLLQFH